jgi:hypothetical protein
MGYFYGIRMYLKNPLNPRFVREYLILLSYLMKINKASSKNSDYQMEDTLHQTEYSEAPNLSDYIREPKRILTIHQFTSIAGM